MLILMPYSLIFDTKVINALWFVVLLPIYPKGNDYLSIKYQTIGHQNQHCSLILYGLIFDTNVMVALWFVVLLPIYPNRSGHAVCYLNSFKWTIYRVQFTCVPLHRFISQFIATLNGAN